MSRSVTLRWVVALVVLLAGIPVLTAGPASAAPTLPASFTDTKVASVSRSTAIAFMPDGRMLITTQPGQLRIMTGDTLLPTPALDLAGKLCSNSERGLLGVAADPDPASKAIYLYYTVRGSAGADCPSGLPSEGAPTNQVSKFILGDNNIVNPASEVPLLRGIYSTAGNHNAGDLAVGHDGNLYVSVGDGGCDYRAPKGCGGSNDASRDMNILNGKIVRITRAGGVPADNPFVGANTARCNEAPAPDGSTCREAFAVGLRNPFRFAFDPNVAGISFRINDVGQNVWEEIDQGISGADYGWNAREGHCANNQASCPVGSTPADYIDPIHDYSHSATGCGSITGGAYVPNTAGWPAAYTGGYLFGDYVCGKIFLLSAGGVRTDFATDLGVNSAVHLEFGPSPAGQALYYTSYLDGIHRITYTAAQNRVPTAVVKATPSSGATPLTVTLDGTGSSDPDGDTLTYLWSFGDGTADASTSTPTTTHTYTTSGSFTATLRVRDAKGATSAPVTTSISSGNSAPVVTITAPAATDLFSVGASYTLRGTATDAQDGALAGSKLTWTVIKHHDQHTHPFLGPVTGSTATLVAPPPEDLLAATNSYLEIRLTATDSSGLSTTVTQNFNPRKVAVTVATAPVGRRVSVNNTGVTGPTTVTSWAGATLQVSAATQTDAAGRTYAFDGWSDGGAAAHAVTTPANPITLTASLSLRGLQGAYFDALNFTGARFDRLDPTVGFTWGRAAPIAGIGADTFSLRWAGQILPRYSQNYTFSTTSDDGIRMWVNGVPVINQWTDHSTTVHTGTAALLANVRYSIVIEYYDNTYSAVAQVRWASASQPAELLPVDRLFPTYAINFQPAGVPVPVGYVADTGAAFGPVAGVSFGWNRNNSAQTRDRNSALSPDQRYDTVSHMQVSANPNASWELAVPNGSYRVRVVSGDAGYLNSTYGVSAEGVAVVSGVPTAAQRWLDGSADITVTDGRLTLTNSSGAVNNKINFVEISLR